MSAIRYSLLAAAAFALVGGCSKPSEQPPANPVRERPDPPVVAKPLPPAERADQGEGPAEPVPATAPPPHATSPEATGGSDAPPRPDFLADLASSDPLARQRAGDQLAALESEDAQPLLLAGLEHRRVEVRRGAAAGLQGRYRPPPPEVVEALLVALDDDDDTVRGLALEELTSLEGDAVLPAVPRLAEALVVGKETAQNRRRIARLIAKQGTVAQAVLPQLIEAMRIDPDANVRGACLYALWSVSTGPAESLDALRQVLREDDSAMIRRVAARRIGDYGPAAVAAADDLVAALEDDDNEVRRSAADALARLGPTVVPPLIDRLDDPRPEQRAIAALILGDLGPAAAAAVPDLRRLLEDEDERVQGAAEGALLAIGMGSP